MTATLPPPTSTPIRLIVPTAGRATIQVEVGPHEIRIGDRRAGFDRIEAIAYSTSSHRANLVQRRIRRRVWIATHGQELELHLGGQAFGRQFDEVQSLAHHAIVSALHDSVELRLRFSIVARIREGASVAIGPIQLDRTGVAMIRRAGVGAHHRWRSVPSAELHGDRVVVSEGRDGPILATISADRPNAVLLPELLLSCAGALV